MESIFAIRRFDLRKMYACEEFERFIGSKLGNDLCITDPDRAKRLRRYARDGMDGSTHSEVIEDWREFLDSLKLPSKVYDRISREIDHCEQWHHENGSLFKIIG
jgi:hypothetical protein